MKAIKVRGRRPNLTQLLKDHAACSEGRKWATRFTDPAKAWDACPDGNWLAWALGRLYKHGLLGPGRNIDETRPFACWCVRNTPLPGGGVVYDLLVIDEARERLERAERAEIIADPVDKLADVVSDMTPLGEALLCAERALWFACYGSINTTLESATHYAAKAAGHIGGWRSGHSMFSVHYAKVEKRAYQKAIRVQADQLRAMFGNPFLPSRKKRALS